MQSRCSVPEMPVTPKPSLRIALLCASAMALAGCATVSLNQPAPVVTLPAPASAPASAPMPQAATPAAAASSAEAQPLSSQPGITVQPLAPSAAASAASGPASAASGPAGAASAPNATASAPTTAPGQPPQPGASAPAAAASAPAALPPGAVRYVCDDRSSFIASFGDVSVTLSTALSSIRLEQTVAADGARFANGNLVVWFKGREATVNNLSQPGSTTLCIEQR